MGNKYVVVDLETTGNAPKKGDRIIQFAAVVIENEKIIEEFSSFVNPGQQIPPFIVELTGITDEMVNDAPLFSEIAPKVLTLLNDAYFVAHNVMFDLTFLQEELMDAGFAGFYGPVIDTVEISRILLPTADSFKLSELAMREGIQHDRPHQADSDAYVTAELLLILMNKFDQLPLQTIRQLYQLSGGIQSDLDEWLADMIRYKEGKLDYLPAELDIFRGIVLKKELEDEDSTSSPERKRAFPHLESEKEAIFKRAFSSFELRLGQFKMMDSVYQAFQDNKHALIEAGTGVGKSLAYLLPAAFYSREQGEALVISTYTTQLQEQLLTKDIPLLKQMLPFPVKAVLLKGRGHYISLAKFEQTLKETEDKYDTILSKMQILVWLTQTMTGDIDELHLSSGGMIYWNKIKNDETDFLLGKAWITRDFYARARKNVQQADIIITNHSLLLTDVMLNNSILPTYSHLVIDEGHHFVKASGQHFGDSLDYLTVRQLLSQIGLLEHRQLLYRLENLLKENGLAQSNSVHSFEVNQIMTNLLYEMDEFFKGIGIVARKNSKAKKALNKLKCSYNPAGDEKESKAVKAIAERFYFLLKDLQLELSSKYELIGEIKDSLSDKDKTFMIEVSSLLEHLTAVKDSVRRIFLYPSNEFVTWLEVDLRAVQNATSVYLQPITVAPYLKERFFNQKKSVVMTSATLTIKNSFTYMLHELGLDEIECTLERIESPFDYNNQVKLIIPEDLPEVNAVSIDEYVAAISEHIISIAEATKGRMLILFTAHDMLRKTYSLIKESGFLDDFVLFAQGISSGSRSRLTRNFQRFEKSILLGTSSFWEGIDIPGEDLTCLIMIRLPFSSPDEPLTEAKSRQITENGGNAFSDYSLPEAVIRFKQGFGRLIRTKSDKGFIFVFDRRIITTKYGKAFIESIPPIAVEKKDIHETIELIHEWL